MARDTLRDRVWHQIIEFCDNDSDWRKDDIVQTTDASDRTVHDVMKTAVSYGIVERREEARSVEFGDGREQLQQVAIYSSVDTARETPEDRQTDDSTPTPEADKPDSDAEPGDMATENPANGENPDSNPTPDADTTDSTTPNVEFGDASPAAFAESLPHVGEGKAWRLWDSGFTGYEDLFTTSVESLTSVSGIGEKTARAIKTRMAGGALANMEMEKDDLVGMETAAVADMFNLSESLADDLQKDISRAKVFG